MKKDHKTKMAPIITNELYEEAIKEKKKINNVGDKHWYIEDNVSGEIVRYDWSKVGVPEDEVENAQNYLIVYFGGYQDSANRIIFRINTAQQVFVTITRIYTYKKNFIKKPFRKWSLSDLTEMVQHYLRRELQKDFDLKSEDFMGRGPIANLCNHIEMIKNHYQLGLISDGFDTNTPVSLLEHICKDYLESYGVNFSQWRLGGSHGEVPTATAILFLGFCIKILESSETKMLLAWYKYAQNDAVWVSQFFPGYRNRRETVFDEFIRMGEKTPYIKKDTVEKFTRIKQSLEIAKGTPIKRFPWSSVEEVSKSSSKVYGACVSILLMLTGARLSEIHSIRVGWFNQDSKGNWVFKSGILKTNYGIGTVRSLSGLNAIAYEILCDLSYVDKRNIEDEHLTTERYKKTRYYDDVKKLTSTSTVRNSLKDTFAEFLEANSEDMKIEIVQGLPKGKVTPHMFRHSWAAFALRRFDGDVLEEIRHHFRHCFGSYHTRRYVVGKLTPNQQRSLEQEYLKEIFERISKDESSFVGPIAIELKKIINENVNVVGIDELDQIESKLNEFSDDVVRVVAHEWGLCVLKRSTASNAQCFDKTAKIALVDEGSSFEKCTRCIHRITNSSNKEDILRIGLSHQDYLKNYPINLPALKKASEVALKNAERIIKEIEGEF
jgi:integrase